MIESFSYKTTNRRSPMWVGAVVLGIAISGVSAVACSDGGADGLLGGRSGATADGGSGGPNGNGGGDPPGVIDGGVFGEAGPEATKAESLFRALQNELVTTCGGTNGVCHVSGVYQNNQTPKFLADPDPYVAIHDYPGVIVKDPYGSKLIVKGPHAGPAFTGTSKELGDKVLAWLTQEAFAIKVQPLPGSGAFSVANGANTVDVSKGGTGVDGTKITFDAATSGSILTLTNMKLVAPAATGVHLAHPIFVMVPKTGSPIEDPVDSFSNLDQTQAAGSTQPLGTGTLILSSWDPTNQLRIDFTTLAAAAAPPDAGTTGGCKSVATFTANAVPALQNNTCLNCHGAAGGSGFASLDMSQVGKDNAKACAQALGRVNLANKAQSQIITAATGGIAAHPYKNAPAAYTTAMLNWINNE
jgi:hypothetical protein